MEDFDQNDLTVTDNELYLLKFALDYMLSNADLNPDERVKARNFHRLVQQQITDIEEK